MSQFKNRVRRIEASKGAGRCTQQITIMQGDDPSPPETCDCGGTHIIRVRVVYGDERRK